MATLAQNGAMKGGAMKRRLTDYLRDSGIVPLIITLVSLPTSMRAQSYATTATTTECNSAIAALKAKTPPIPGATDNAWWTATRCGASGGSALAAAMTKLGASADTSSLGYAELALGNIRDAAIFQNAKLLTTSTSATNAARIMALRVLLAQHSGGLYLPRPIRLTTDGRRCQSGVLPRDAVYAGASLPADYAQQAFVAAKQVAGSTAASDVRLVARCVQELFAAVVPADVNASLLRLTYVCGNKFRIQNPNPSWADVRYDVANTDDSGEYEMPPSGDIVIETVARGTTRLWFGGQLVQSVANTATTCAS